MTLLSLLSLCYSTMLSSTQGLSLISPLLSWLGAVTVQSYRWGTLAS